MVPRNNAPTDIMCRRTPLPLCGKFLLSGRRVSISTNHEVILQVAPIAGFVPVADTNLTPDITWDIVGTPGGNEIDSEECDITLGDRSLYLSMGAEQWFAFDLETYEGAGFVLVADSYPGRRRNAQHYLMSIACYVSASLHAEFGEKLP